MADVHRLRMAGAATGAGVSRAELPRASAASAAADPAPDAPGAQRYESSGDQRRRKKRKSTYEVRKGEIAQLREEATALEARVETLNLMERQPDLLTEAALMNSMLRHAHSEQQLSLATAQSAISGQLVTQSASPHNPLHTYIRLGSDPAQRRETLLAMCEPKLRDALAYVQSRAKFLDPLNPHQAYERFENADGDFCGTRLDVYQFAGVQGAKQVLDTLMQYHKNVEISVSELLGAITVREDYDLVESVRSGCEGAGGGVDRNRDGDERSISTGIASNFRLMTNECGIRSEVNLVTYMQYYESHEAVGGGPCAVCLVDWVDDDELHPYNPRELVCKQISEAIVLTEHRRKKEKKAHVGGRSTARNGNFRGGDIGTGEWCADGEDEEEEEVVVVMTRCKFSKVCRPAFPISRREEHMLRSGVCWGPVMVQAISDLLYPDLVRQSDPERVLAALLE